MQPEDLIGQLLGHYRMRRQIGYGGMATVFLAEDIHLGREVAVKVFWPHPGETQDFLRRFSREARVLAQLDHPQILPVYEYGEQGNMAYLVTPYLPGGTLKQNLQERKVLPPSEAVALLLQILPALQYAHDRNLIHRDIKPGNLLFKADGSMILADFGLVKVVGEDGTNKLETLNQTTQGATGTPEYMAPEQIEGHAVLASDIYALGVVLYELVTGTRPFTGENLLGILIKHVQEPPRPPRELNPYISPQLEAVILRALEKDPNRRFARPVDFQQALQQINAPQGRINNPVSNPGIAHPTGNPVSQNSVAGLENAAAMTGNHSPTLAASWRQTPGPVSPPPVGSVSPQGQGVNGQNMPAKGQRSSLPNMPSHSSGFYGAPTTNQPLSTGTTQSSQQLFIQPTQQRASEPGFAQQPWSQTPGVAQQSWTQLPGQQPPITPLRKSRRTSLVVLIVLILLLASVIGALVLTPGSGLFARYQATATAKIPGSSSTVFSQTPLARGGITATPATTTRPVPPTLTTCPAPGTARAAIMAPFLAGSDPTIVYIVNEGTADAPTLGTIKTYDTVNQKKTELAKNNQTVIDAAQVSNDGQWVLFSASIAGQEELRLVRMDGQGEQTLLCAPSGSLIRYAQWSLDQKYVIFDEFPAVGEPTVYLLNIQTGALTVEIMAPGSGTSLFPRTWLDYNRVLMVGIVPNSDAPPQNVYVLDIRNGANQSTASILKIVDSSTYPACWDFDSSYDGKTLYIVQCTPGNPNGSSHIVNQPVSGEPPGVVLNSSTLSLSTVRVIDANNAHLLALASDIGLGTPKGDPAHDGLYLITTGSGTTKRLTSTPSGAFSSLNASSQYFWSNVSRDGSMYALQTVNYATREYTLSYGLLNGGSPTVFADITSTVLEIAGWTTT